MTARPIETVGPAEAAEADLLARMAGGDREAFAALFRRYQTTIYRFARQMTGAKEDAEDVTQDVFIVLAAQSHRYDSSLGSLGTYLYGIARNLVRKRQRRWRAGTDSATLEETGSPAIAVSVDPIDAISQAERIRALRQAILRLPIRYREVLVLCALNGVSYDEASRIIGCPVGTVRSRLHRARQILTDRRQRLDDAPSEAKRRFPWVSGNTRTVRGET